MRGWLRSFLAWLDKRFPEKVVITQASYEALKAQVDKLSSANNAEARLKHLEAEVNKFNLHMGFGGAVLPPKMAQPFQR